MPIPFDVSCLADGRLLCSLRRRENRNKGATFEALVELHSAFDLGKNRVIAAHAYVFTGPPLGAALTHEDVARDHGFAAVFLHAKTAAC